MNHGADAKQAADDKKAHGAAPHGRFLLKLSGEAFAGGGGLGVDPDVVHAIAREVAAVVRDGAEIAIVIGGGNFF
ncbi:UMP kinase, partial [Streptomyces tendae]